MPFWVFTGFDLNMSTCKFSCSRDCLRPFGIFAYNLYFVFVFFSLLFCFVLPPTFACDGILEYCGLVSCTKGVTLFVHCFGIHYTNMAFNIPWQMGPIIAKKLVLILFPFFFFSSPVPKLKSRSSSICVFAMKIEMWFFDGGDLLSCKRLLSHSLDVCTCLFSIDVIKESQCRDRCHCWR